MIDQYSADKIIKYSRPKHVYFLEIKHDPGLRHDKCVFLTVEEQNIYLEKYLDNFINRMISNGVNLDKIYYNDIECNGGGEMKSGADLIKAFNSYSSMFNIIIYRQGAPNFSPLMHCRLYITLSALKCNPAPPEFKY